MVIVNTLHGFWWSISPTNSQTYHFLGDTLSGILERATCMLRLFLPANSELKVLALCRGQESLAATGSRGR
jgi:hypothetical protein